MTSVFLKTLVLVLISLGGFLMAPFAFPFTMIAVWCAILAPLAIGAYLRDRADPIRWDRGIAAPPDDASTTTTKRAA